MATMLMWLLLMATATVIGMVCMIPGWIARKIRDRRELHMIRTLYPNIARRRRAV